MGLFEKALTLKTRPYARKESTPPRSGLLRKSSRYFVHTPSQPADVVTGAAGEAPQAAEGHDVAAEPPRLPPQQLRARLVADAQALEPSLQAPGAYFDLLADRLSLTNAAILVRDVGGPGYAAWAARGFDRTTFRHLRFTSEELERFGLLGSAVVDIGGAEELEAYRPYFSMREYSVLERLVLAPVTFEGEVVAVVLAAGTQTEPLVEGVPEALEELAEANPGSLFALREKLLEQMTAHAAMSDVSAEQQLRKLIESAAATDESFHIIMLPLGEVLETVQRSVPSLDRYRLAGEIFALVSSLAVDIGPVRLSPNRETVVLFPEGAKADPALICHQLQMHIARALAGASSPDGRLPCAASSYPSDGRTPEELLGVAATPANDRTEDGADR